MEMHRYKDRADQMNSLAGLTVAALSAALSEKGRATLAVPGGTTPAPYFEALTKSDLDWSKVTILLTDERFVPVTSDRSNARLLNRHLLTGNVAGAQFIPYYREDTTPDELPDVLDPVLAPYLPLDFCVLGMGADMHTASIFPGADRLSEALSLDGKHIVLPLRAPGAPEPRLTLTAPVLRAAGEIHLLITGPEKLAALDMAQEINDWQKAPVLAVLQREHDVHVHYAD